MPPPLTSLTILKINRVVQGYFDSHGGSAMSADEAADLVYAAGIMTPGEGPPESRGFTFREFLRQLRNIYGYENLYRLVGVTQKNNQPGSHWVVHRVHPPAEVQIQEILDRPPVLTGPSGKSGSGDDPPALPDYLGEGLDIVFVGTSVGELSAAEGHHYAHPTNRFWDLLNGAGLVSDLVGSENDHMIVDERCGLTDLVKRKASGSDRTLNAEDFDVAGFVEKIKKYKPKVVAFNGKRSYREVFGSDPEDYGPADEVIGDSWVWVLPSSSGSDASMTYEKKLHWYRKLRAFLSKL